MTQSTSRAAKDWELTFTSKFSLDGFWRLPLSSQNGTPNTAQYAENDVAVTVG
jgi:hypothetical protein